MAFFCAHLLGDIQGKIPLTTVLIRKNFNQNGGNPNGIQLCPGKRKFNKEWNEKERWYRESGMSEDTIREMYEYDWREFNSTRKFYRYGDDDVDVESIVEEDGDSIDKTLSEEWIELLDTPNLVRKVRKLSADYIEIIDLMVRENLTQEEVARRMHCSQQNIAKKIEKIKKLLS